MSSLGYSALSLEQSATIKKNLAADQDNKSADKLLGILGDVYGALKAVSPNNAAIGEPDGSAMVDWFKKWADAYQQGSRFFHNLNHLDEMTDTPRRPYGDLAIALEMTGAELTRLQEQNILAGFYHDVEYVHVDGDITPYGQKVLEGFILQDPSNKSWKIKDGFDDQEHKPIIDMVLKVFGKKNGETLSPFAGMNELLSAMEAAIDLKGQGVSDKDILQVVASIEATIPFRDEKRMNALRDRVAAAAQGIGLTLEERDVDIIVGGATVLANQDVIGLAGGLNHDRPLTADNIRKVLKGTDELHAEEVPALRTSIPGDYPPRELAKALLKQHTLFNYMFSDNATFPNGAAMNTKVFHSVKFSNGTAFPPRDEIDKHEHMARKQIAPVLGLVLRARLAAVRAIAGLAQERQLGDTPIKDLLAGGMSEVEAKIDKAYKFSTPEEQMAFDVLFNERVVGTHDVPRSLLAAYLLQKLGKKEIEKLAPDVDLNPKHEIRVAVNSGDHQKFLEQINALVAKGDIDDLAPMLFRKEPQIEAFVHTTDVSPGWVGKTGADRTIVTARVGKSQ